MKTKPLDKDLLEILACPACRGDVAQQEDKIVCLKCKRKYPIKDNIPVMLVDESENLN
ncbi:MAG: Trm112 family protein [Candidatus Omnitrophica bacterium]|nr:Trm112 family protein [Candidatus Omnitrophota bacterium]